jgi:Cof subfamily protein (haloacid dehalogenase superfamily)
VNSSIAGGLGNGGQRITTAERQSPPRAGDLRLVVTDMDGTLLTADGAIPDGLWPLLDQMRARGITFVPASGRQYATLARAFSHAPSGVSFIAENGSLVVHDGRVLSTTCVARGLVGSVIDAVRRAADSAHDLGLVVCGLRSAYIERFDPAFSAQAAIYYAQLKIVDDLHEVADDVLKLAVYDFGDAERSEAAIFAPIGDDHQVVVSGRHWIDIMASDVNKGVAVRKLQTALAVTPAQTAAFGDYLNDLEMLDAAGLSYAVANAHPEVRARARFIAPSNVDQGVITVLSHLIG